MPLHPQQLRAHLRTKRAQDVAVQGGSTYIDEVGDVVDVVFTDSGVGGGQVQQVVVPGFSTLQLVLRIFGLSLKKQNGASEYKQDAPFTASLLQGPAAPCSLGVTR